MISSLALALLVIVMVTLIVIAARAYLRSPGPGGHAGPPGTPAEPPAPPPASSAPWHWPDSGARRDREVHRPGPPPPRHDPDGFDGPPLPDMMPAPVHRWQPPADVLRVWEPGTRILPSCHCGSYGHRDDQHDAATAAWPAPDPSSHPYPAAPAPETCPDYDFGCALADAERTAQILARAARVDQAVTALTDPDLVDPWPPHVPWDLDAGLVAA